MEKPGAHFEKTKREKREIKALLTIVLSSCLATNVVKESVGLGMDGVRYRVHSKHTDQKFELLHDLVKQMDERHGYWMAAINESAKDFSSSLNAIEKRLDLMRREIKQNDRELEMLIANFYKEEG